MTHINQRRDPAATWTQFNPILQKGEFGWESDTFKAKMGDGVKTWTQLPYAIDPTAFASAAAVTAAAAVKVDKYTNIDNADLNTVTTSGNYRGNTLTNTPSGTTGGFISVTGNGAGYAVQTFFNYGGTRTWMRTNNNGTWGSWTEIGSVVSPIFTGDPKAPTPATTDNDTSIATTAFVKAQGYVTAASPTFTGDPKAPTPATTDNDTSLATTAFVHNLIGDSGAGVTTGVWLLLGTDVAWGAGWSAYGSTQWGPPAFRRDGNRVTVRGLVAGPAVGTTTSSTIFTLPVGYRPDALSGIHIPVHNLKNAIARIQITSAGAVNTNYTSIATVLGDWWTLDSITFICKDGA